jgi:hypothetical protein
MMYVAVAWRVGVVVIQAFSVDQGNGCWGRVCCVAGWLPVHSTSLSDALRVKSLHEASRGEVDDTAAERHHDDKKSRREGFGALPSWASHDCGFVGWPAGQWVVGDRATGRPRLQPASR